MRRNRLARLRRALDKRQSTLTVLMENVHKPHNYSAVLRSCDAVGIHRAHAISTPHLVHSVHNQRHRSSSGSASKWVRVQVHTDIHEACRTLQSRGFAVLAAHFSSRAVDFRTVDYTQPTALLLGAEKDGVSSQAAELADHHVVIPMLGLVQSLNVSVAAAVLLFEAQRQRQAAGMYEQRQLPQEEYDRLLFEGLHPKLARYCRRKGIPYPPLDDNGELVEDVRRG